VEIDPDLDMGYSYLIKGLMQVCDWKRLADLMVAFDRLKERPGPKKKKLVEHPFVSIIRHADPALNMAAAKAKACRVSTTVSGLKLHPQFYDKRRRKNKITLGYYSGNIRDHANAHQIHSIFGCHNRKEFEIFCYSGGKDDGSPYYEKIKKDCDTFVDIRNLSDIEAARRIYQDQVDILVDLVGSIDGGRPKIFALRPAPVQIRYLGMPGTSGADFYDYLVTDRIVTPDVDAPFYTERFINMPHCYQVNSIQLVSNRKRTKKDFGLPKEGFIFCSFNTNYKFDRITFHVWMQILEKTPGSVLWLLSQNSAAETNLKAQAESCGVDSDRIIFTEKLPKPVHLSRLELADLALDTRIVNGAASTSDVLRMGLPIITLKGTHFASRMSASILTAIGLPELITHDFEEYEKLAVHLANSGALNAIRNKLEKNRKTSPLFDTPRFVRNLESAFRTARDIFLTGQRARQIDVAESSL
jgi:protein O-GlcNAc transferase